MLAARISLNNARKVHTWIKPEGYDTGIRVYNCIAKEKVPFVVRNQQFTSWYTCGPTVYDSAHIGHASCYMKLDIIQRIFTEYFKINLVTVMNITDIDDKIITKSLESYKSPTEITQQYEKEFWEDLNTLNIRKPSLVLRVSENMDVIEKFINKLMDKQYAYKDEGGSIVFNLKTINNYGRLQNIRSKSINISENHSKASNVNFAMWKSVKENEPFWIIKHGKGRPGWHTECSALASAVFGSCVDVHAGGIDLRFPHHENEEAQCCAYFLKPQWVNYWFHTGHLMQDNIKMSKSLKNTLTIKEMLKICDADTFRMMCLMSHYRKNMVFTEEYVKSAITLIKSYKNFITDCNAFISGKLKCSINTEVLSNYLSNTISSISLALKDDFDTATCIKEITSIVATTRKMLHTSATSTNNNLADLASVISVLNFLTNVLHQFGIDLNSNVNVNRIESCDLASVLDLVNEFRQNVRNLGLADKNTVLLKLCDGVRDNLKQSGITIKDHGNVSLWGK